MTLRTILVPVAAILIFVLLWELLVWANGWPNYVMASPSDLPPAYARYWELFIVMGWQTLWRTVVGLVLAIIFGVFLGTCAPNMSGLPGFRAWRSIGGHKGGLGEIPPHRSPGRWRGGGPRSTRPATC